MIGTAKPVAGDARVEMRPHSATERADMETPHLQPTLPGAAPETPALRRAGCVARKSGSVGGVPGRPGAPTRHAGGLDVGTLFERSSDGGRRRWVRAIPEPAARSRPTGSAPQ